MVDEGREITIRKGRDRLKGSTSQIVLLLLAVYSGFRTL